MRESPGAKQRRRQPPLGEAVAHSQKGAADDGDSLPNTLSQTGKTDAAVLSVKLLRLNLCYEVLIGCYHCGSGIIPRLFDEPAH
jgi:hypothetical protein